MRFRKGDLVSFLNEKGGGTVSRVDEKGFVYVVTTDGFEIPVPEKELVFSGTFSPDHRETEPDRPMSHPRRVLSEPSKPVRKEPVSQIVLPTKISAEVDVNVLLGFTPQNNKPVFNNIINCYLINDSPYYLYYMAGKKEGGRLEYISSGILESDTKAILANFDQTSLSKISDIHIQSLFLTSGQYFRKQPLDVMVNLNLVNFSKESYYRENEYFNGKAVLFNILEKSWNREENSEIPGEVLEQKLQADRIIKPRPKEPVTDTMQVDLHFDGEGMANSQLSPAAILALQMSRFHAAIEEAISKNMRRLVIIHGVGQGTLKLQIRTELQEKYPKFLFQDASFKEYGFGATMVHIITDQKQ